MQTTIGIDPGGKTGIAFYQNGKIEYLITYPPAKTLQLISEAADRENLLVIFEDSRKQPIFSRGTNARAAGRIARNVGMIDGQCRDIEDMCGRLNIPVIGVSPKRKGKKLTSKQFNELTGWTEKSNQHERDAGTVAWPYRYLARPALWRQFLS